MEIDLISPRPLAAVALLLEKEFDRIVTYEDMPYEHPDDMVRNEAGEFIPRGGRIALHYAAEDSLQEALTRCLDVYARSGCPGVFAIEESGSDYHLVPRLFRNGNGALEERTSLLDASIALPPQTRSAFQLVEDIIRALTVATGESVCLGTLPTNALMQHACTGQPTGKARDLLLGLFREMGCELSWHLLNNPGTTEFVLNIHSLQNMAAHPKFDLDENLPAQVARPWVTGLIRE